MLLLDGVAARTLPPIALRRRVMLVGQEPKLLGMQAREAIIYPLKLQAIAAAEIKQRLSDVVELLQLDLAWLDRSAEQLSTGQKQQIAIARGLITRPQILLLDEPTANLDIATAERILAAIFSHCQSQKIGLIFTTHQLELAVKFSDRLLYLQGGNLCSDRPSSTVDWHSLQQQLRELERQVDDEWT